MALNAGYRGTLLNLGLVGVEYVRLSEYVQTRGTDLAAGLGVAPEHLLYICRCLLDEIRERGCLSRELLRYDPRSTRCPEHLRSADWERRIKQAQGYPVDGDGRAALFHTGTPPYGVTIHNAWRQAGRGGSKPALQRIFEHLMDRLGGLMANEHLLEETLRFLQRGSFLVATEVYGTRDPATVCQVNAETVQLRLAEEGERCRCRVCRNVVAPAQPGLPCARCHGELMLFTDRMVDASRSAQRIARDSVGVLTAGEHTAQITTDDRLALEQAFKAKPEEARTNVLACSPTLEMGIDVGGLDAIILRNIPPRPDHYAQRGGRAGRRSRVGLVVGYARSTPHDQYFYDRPEEMIAGEVPAPSLALGNRDIIFRHLHALAFGAADPGVAGKMVDYISPEGAVKPEAVEALIAGVRQQREAALDMAMAAWQPEVLAEAGLDRETLGQSLDRLPERIQDVMDRTGRQVVELRQALNEYYHELHDPQAARRAGDLVARLLGIPTGRRGENADADDRSAGYPLRRFAEFGLLPGYEFPSEPATLRLAGDPHEDDPLATVRRFGIGQFMPTAHVYARTRRWRVSGLDKSSPWNPQGENPTQPFRICRGCGVRYEADHPRCPRCRTDQPGRDLPAAEYAGFLARREEAPVLDEEERYAVRDLVQPWPQWNGDVVGRWAVGPGWGLRLSRREAHALAQRGP